MDVSIVVAKTTRENVIPAGAKVRPTTPSRSFPLDSQHGMHALTLEAARIARKPLMMLVCAVLDMYTEVETWKKEPY